MRVGQCSFGPHKPGLPVCDSRTRYLIVAEYANRQSDEVENLVILQVRFLPRSLRPDDPVVQRQRRLDDTQEIGGSIPPGITETAVCRCFGSTRPW